MKYTFVKIKPVVVFFFFFRTLSMIDERMKLNWFQMSSASSQRTYICVHICEMWQANFRIYVRVSVWQTINRTINFMNMMCIPCVIPVSSIQLIISQNSLPSLQYPMTEMLQFLRGFSDLNGRTCYHEHENESDMQFFSHIHTAICHTMTVRSCFTDTWCNEKSHENNIASNFMSWKWYDSSLFACIRASGGFVWLSLIFIERDREYKFWT